MQKYKNLLKLVTFSTLTLAMEKENMQENVLENENSTTPSLEDINKELIIYTKFEDNNYCFPNFFTKDCRIFVRDRKYNFLMQHFEFYVLHKYLSVYL